MVKQQFLQRILLGTPAPAALSTSLSPSSLAAAFLSLLFDDATLGIIVVEMDKLMTKPP